MKKKLLAVVVVGSLLALGGKAQATQIGGLYNTGVNSSGGLLAGGTIDSHYTLSNGASTYTLNAGYPIGAPWTSNTATSQWIGPNSYAGGNYAATNYFYTTSFFLANDTNLDTVDITGLWATDDNAVNIFVNGLATGISVSAVNFQFNAFELNDINSDFVYGNNTITFQVLNGGGGPTGLEVNNLSGTYAPVPEPSTMLLFGAGVAGLAFWRRKNS